MMIIAVKLYEDTYRYFEVEGVDGSSITSREKAARIAFRFYHKRPEKDATELNETTQTVTIHPINVEAGKVMLSHIVEPVVLKGDT